jgi:hypothetical protein
LICDALRDLLNQYGHISFSSLSIGAKFISLTGVKYKVLHRALQTKQYTITGEVKFEVTMVDGSTFETLMTAEQLRNNNFWRKLHE